MEKKPVALCFGAVPEFIENGASCICISACACAEEAYPALEAAGNDGRICVIADAEGIAAAWRFAAGFSDRIAGMVALAEGGCAEDICRVKFVPVLAPADTVRLLRGEGNEFASVLPDNAGEILNWMRLQDIEDRQEVVALQPGLWNINTGFIDSFYLIEGRERALLIDTGMGRKDIMPLVSRMTPLPVSLAITHVHGDHVMHADEVETAYMSALDFPLIDTFVEAMLPGKAYTAEMFTPVEEGDTIDLGGIEIEIIALPGHTPGSLCFVDHVHRCFFTGDAIGSGIGVLMAIPGTLSIEEYRKNLIEFRRKIEGIADYAFYGGHRIQEKGKDRLAGIRNPLCPELVDDMIALCDALLEGKELPCQIQSNRFVEEEVHYVSYGRADMWYCPSQLSFSRV